MEKRYYKIGETFKLCEDITVRCVESGEQSDQACLNCMLSNNTMCNTIKCTKRERKDHKDVFFKLVTP